MTPMVIHRARIAPTSRPRNAPRMRLGLVGFDVSGLSSMTTPSSGANSTATNQDMISAMPTTTKIEKVYSPAELFAKPIGTKPAAVTNDPVSIGTASVL